MKQKHIFLNSLFFVLGFSVVFAILGILLNTVLQAFAYDVQVWLARIGGIIVIFFGLYLVGLIEIPFLEREYKFKIGLKFNSKYFTSFLFGAALAAGWTPCVGITFGSILGLAAIKPLNNEKSGKYPVAKEIVNPSGFINSNNITVAELIGKKVILIDFWTYSCINCLRTLPYLNSWYEKYKDKGFVIIGVHTPEFQFEQNYDNVLAAVQKFGIKYPVVLDNNYSTWAAYGNLYWPHDYLIDIDGFIVHDHIGEGNYEETEKNIQDALKERMAVLKINEEINTEVSKPAGVTNVDFTKVNSPEIYFGASRNTYLGNGKSNMVGLQNLSEPTEIRTNTLYLAGTWDFQNEFAENKNPGSKIIFRYSAKNVNFVASAKENITIQVLRDGRPLGNESGKDVSRINGSSIVTISQPRLYALIEDPQGYGEHTLDITIEDPGLDAFTFTFG